jgi:hypothetical protein
MPENVKSQIFALALVFFVCMIGVAYHALETRRIKREKAAKPAHAGASASRSLP